MAGVRALIKEVIPTAKFANVQLELEIQGEHIEFDVKKDDVKEALSKAYDIADEVLQDKRESILAELNSGNN